MRRRLVSVSDRCGPDCWVLSDRLYLWHSELSLGHGERDC